MTKTTNMMIGIFAVLGTVGCGKDEALPPKPDDLSCGEYEFDYDDGVWECDDRTSRYYGHYFFTVEHGSNHIRLCMLILPIRSINKAQGLKKGFGSGSAVSGS
ncbi:hypothetical protein GCM10020331_042940 [Ectobacillus funiculus]